MAEAMIAAWVGKIKKRYLIRVFRWLVGEFASQE